VNATKEDVQVKIWITDTGIGMNSEQIQYVFDELYKADPARQDHASTGLGLTICKRIVEKHGGKIWVESPGPGKGTTVFFTLPSPVE
jgi:signal transduction histidine kinase